MDSIEEKNLQFIAFDGMQAKQIPWVEKFKVDILTVNCFQTLSLERSETGFRSRTEKSAD